MNVEQCRRMAEDVQDRHWWFGPAFSSFIFSYFFLTFWLFNNLLGFVLLVFPFLFHFYFLLISVCSAGTKQSKEISLFFIFALFVMSRVWNRRSVVTAIHIFYLSVWQLIFCVFTSYVTDTQWCSSLFVKQWEWSGWWENVLENFFNVLGFTRVFFLPMCIHGV